MNKKLFFEKYVQPRTVVHCATEELANELLAKAHEYGLKWQSGTSYLEENYFNVEEEICYNLFLCVFDGKNNFQEDGYTIIEFNGFEDNTLKAYFEQLEQEDPFKTWGKLYEVEEAIETIMKCDELTFSGGLLYKEEFEKIKGYLELSILYKEKADIYDRNYGHQMDINDHTRLLEVKKLLGERE